jgi:4-diphosphocytidyl-2-C-methyl-D-erythritol kinase
MNLDRLSHCKVNLVLNILGKRPDGYHELETIMHPVWAFDRLTFARRGAGLQLTCSEPSLPVDEGNLVYRAATLFLETAGIREGVRIHLEKRLPLAAGLGGGSGNAACTLRSLNDLFGAPLTEGQLHALAARLGSDIPFFLPKGPALATGRGEQIQTLEEFPALEAAAFLIVHPGFGISTSWAYKELAKFPQALKGRPGRAARMVELLQKSLDAAGKGLYNSLEAPALPKYPLLGIFQDFFQQHGAPCLMSGSGSSTFAILKNLEQADALAELFTARFGGTYWVRTCRCWQEEERA